MTSEPGRDLRGENENEGRETKIKKGVGTAMWLVIPSAGKSGMEMEQNAHLRNDIRYSLGGRACVSSCVLMCVGLTWSRVNKFPFRTPRLFSSWVRVLSFRTNFTMRSYGSSSAEDRHVVLLVVDEGELAEVSAEKLLRTRRDSARCVRMRYY